MAVNHWETARWVVSQFSSPLKFSNGDWLQFVEGWRKIEESTVLQTVCEIISKAIKELRVTSYAVAEESRGYYNEQLKYLSGLLYAPTLKSILFMLEVLLTDNTGWDEEEDYEFPTSRQMVNRATGGIRGINCEDKIRLFSPVEPNLDATAPRWNQFVDEITSGRKDLAGFLQRAVGYSLGGGTTEQSLFILYGPGSNGKNFFLETLLELFGGMGHQTTFAVLEKAYRSVDAAPGSASPHLAAFRGKRFVMASESHTNSSFNDGLVKSLTGDGWITARPLWKEEVVFQNKIKIWLACNNLPQVFDSTPGFWRRLHIIKLDRIFSDKDRDLHLREKLQAELPGILNWAIKGAQEWHRLSREDPAKGGLRPPLSVRQEVQEYRNGTDLVQLFISENCLIHKEVFAPKKDLHTAFVDFCKTDLGVAEWPSKRFFGALAQKGYGTSRRMLNGKQPHVVLGICLDKDKSRFPLTQEEVTREFPAEEIEDGTTARGPEVGRFEFPADQRSGEGGFA